MAVHSAGILLYRREPLQVFLIHPGGPFWARKDLGAWSIPKGLVGESEEPLAAARREFFEETGFRAEGEAEALGTFRQPSGKRLTVWAMEGDCDPAKLVSGTFSMPWPPRSKQMREFPEADRGAWFGHDEALRRILKGQAPIVEKFYGQRPKG
jgi:predicted NUDIX family NTP pyrophosphohydrolase